MKSNILNTLIENERVRDSKNVPNSKEIKSFFRALSDASSSAGTDALEKLIVELATKGAGRDDAIEQLDRWALEHRSVLGLGELDGEYVYSVLRTRLPGQKTGGMEIESRQGRRGGFRLKSGTISSSAGLEQLSDVTAEELQTVEKAIEKEIEKENKLESSYYEPVRSWAVNTGYDKCVVAGNARRNGKWRNPDLIEIVAEFDNYLGVARWYITAIEVKLKLVPEAVWQAANYKSFAHEAYVAFGLKEEELLIQDDKVLQLAVDLGVGILCLSNESESGKQVFKRIHFPSRGQPSQESIEAALKSFHKAGENKDEISKQVSTLVHGIKSDLKRWTFANMQHEASLK